jgi:hypothetical protein
MPISYLQLWGLLLQQSLETLVHWFNQDGDTSDTTSDDI